MHATNKVTMQTPMNPPENAEQSSMLVLQLLPCLNLLFQERLQLEVLNVQRLKLPRHCFDSRCCTIRVHRRHITLLQVKLGAAESVIDLGRSDWMCQGAQTAASESLTSLKQCSLSRVRRCSAVAVSNVCCSCASELLADAMSSISKATDALRS